MTNEKKQSSEAEASAQMPNRKVEIGARDRVRTTRSLRLLPLSLGTFRFGTIRCRLMA